MSVADDIQIGMLTMKLIEDLRRPVYSYNMGMHRLPSQEKRVRRALKEIDSLVMEYTKKREEILDG